MTTRRFDLHHGFLDGLGVGMTLPIEETRHGKAA
jgi:hypothetical protein